METIYIEFMEELRFILYEIEKSWWNKWIQKSIDKYKENQDVSYYLSAFGGMGSFNDEVPISEVTEALKNITYCMAIEIKEQGKFCLGDILRKKYDFLKQRLESTKESEDYNSKEKDIMHCTSLLSYSDYLIKNYSIGNLHQITNEYLSQKTINNRVK